MTDKEKINAIEEEIRSLTKRIALKDETDSNLQAVYGGQIYILGKVLRFIDSIPEEPASEDLEEEINRYIDPLTPADIQENPFTSIEKCARYFAKWQKGNLWKDAQGDDLPEIDREVIALQGRKVVFAHRPNPKGWDGKNISTGKVTHYTPQTYDKGGWNMPGIKWWLDVPLPDGIE